MTQAILTASNYLQDAIEGLVDLVKQWRRARVRKAMARKTYKALKAQQKQML